MGILTIESSELVGFARLTLGYDPADALGVACPEASTNPVTVYVANGVAFADITEIWLNNDGTGMPTKGWYSDGTIYRYWNEGAGFGASGSCSGQSTELLSLGYGTPAPNACTNFTTSPQSVYIPTGQTFLTATSFYNDINGTVLAASGAYSDGVNFREWSSQLGMVSTGSC